MSDLSARAAVHRVLGDERRLAIVDELRRSDRTPSELGDLTDTPSNLLAHHLEELERAGVVRRVRSEGDGRRRYVQLATEPADLLGMGVPSRPRRAGPVRVHAQRRAVAARRRPVADRTGRPGAPPPGPNPQPRVRPRRRVGWPSEGLDLGRPGPAASTRWTRPSPWSSRSATALASPAAGPTPRCATGRFPTRSGARADVRGRLRPDRANGWTASPRSGRMTADTCVVDGGARAGPRC